MAQAERTDPERSDADPLDEALAACLREPAQRRVAALEAACSALPEHAAELRRRFALLLKLGLADAACESSSIDADAPQAFGDFELGEVLGVGGMGVVHRARQRSLDREVVVKLVRPDLLHFANSRERFRREAEAVAKLSHPGLVPIHVVGEHEGAPYFAMEFVDGFSLAERLEALEGRAPEGLSGADLAPGFAGRTWVAACLDVARQVAEALAHVHSRGILHRDIKPSNVLLTAEGRARLIDFGLHALDREADPAGERLTREGSAPGTLLYMAPEQIERGRYDARSEVYSLGVTLYELLTLQPPFRGADRSSTERLVRAGAPDPIRPRNRAVSGDVEAVTLKALSVDPARRYADADAFADELSRALEGRPVRARPDSVFYRARRWAVREPALATAIVALVTLAVVTPTVVIVAQRRNNARLQRVLSEERLARLHAEDLTSFVVDVLQSSDPNVSDDNQAMRRVLERGVARVDERLAQRPGRRGVVLSMLGRIHGNLGLNREGVELLTSAVEALEAEHRRRVSVDAPADGTRSARLDLAEARARLASLLELVDALSPALRERRALVEDLTAVYGASSWRVVQARADAMRLSSRVPGEKDNGGPEFTPLDIERALREAVAAIEAAPDADADARARAYGWLGSYLTEIVHLTPPAERPAQLIEARRLLENSRTAFAEARLEHTLEYADATMALGVVRKQQGDLREAEQLYRSAIAVSERRLPKDHYRLAGALVNLAGLIDANGDLAGAVEPLERALAMFTRQLGAGHKLTVVTEGNLLGTLMRLGRSDGLLARFDALIERQRDAFGPENLFLSASFDRRSELRRAAGDYAGAREDLEQAHAIVSSMLGDGSAEAERFARRIAALAERSP